MKLFLITLGRRWERCIKVYSEGNKRTEAIRINVGKNKGKSDKTLKRGL